jgi:hypothetical protein
VACFALPLLTIRIAHQWLRPHSLQANVRQCVVLFEPLHVQVRWLRVGTLIGLLGTRLGPWLAVVFVARPNALKCSSREEGTHERDTGDNDCDGGLETTKNEGEAAVGGLLGIRPIQPRE